MRGNRNVTAVFLAEHYVIDAFSNEHGSIFPMGLVDVEFSSSPEFHFYPNTGYRVADVCVDGASQGPLSSYIFTAVDCNHTISVTYEIDIMEITASAGLHGSIDPNGSVGVPYGSDRSFTFAADTGYEIADVLIDGSSIGACSGYTFSGVTENHTISVAFSVALPVEMTTLTTDVKERTVILAWKTATEVNNHGFDIERRIAGRTCSAWTTIGFVQGAGTTTKPQSYSFAQEVRENGRYAYRITQIDHNGKKTFARDVEIEVEYIPKKFALTQNYPNPFNPSTTIGYELPSAEHVTIRVFDMLGNAVAMLVNDNKPAGSYEVEYRPARLSSGVYFYTIHAGTFSAARKFVLLK